MTAGDPETLIERAPLHATRPPKITSDSEFYAESRRSCRCWRSSYRCNHRETSVSKGRCSIPNSEFDNYSKTWSDCSHHSMDIHRQRSSHYSRSVIVIQELNAYYVMLLSSRSFRFFYRSPHYNQNVTSQKAITVRRLEVQLN